MVIKNLVSLDNIIDMRDKVIEEYDKNYFKQESTPLQESSQHPSPPPPSPPPTTTTSPLSAFSSPTHEFSFTLHHNPNAYDTNNNHKTNINKTTTLQQPPPPPAAAIDLSPADDIFFRGHLLPLHPLSHLPDSPRCSTNSMDSFTLPNNLLYYQPNPIGNTSFHCHHQTTFSDFNEPDVTTTNHNRPKSKSFSIFGIPKWKKRSDDVRERDDQDQVKETKELKLDLGQLIKRYMKMVKPLLLFQKSTRSTTKYNGHQSYSFSTNSLTRKPPEMNKGGRRRGQFSAPASMRTSPANSGILIASGCVSPTKSTSESTMEELHAAIQAAIAHCKNSIAMEDKIQSQN
ncbi:hypothetical protein L1987_80439 [Smallanthus sonchifolius]|uniref:Uncharacterized protein n=1 Tax=Smallanthus sonchifolius TaxID=185202 RepID=A0ACB8YP85_9ASTR|nr:hypothetical protein L1987_80439 [Smallanthus sonchifolius]